MEGGKHSKAFQGLGFGVEYCGFLKLQQARNWSGGFQEFRLWCLRFGGAKKTHGASDERDRKRDRWP